MMIPQLQKSSFTSTIFPLLIALVLSACTTEDSTVTATGSQNVNTSANNSYGIVIGGVDSGSVVEDLDPDGDNLLEISGKLDISNSTGEAAFTAETLIGMFGSLTIDVAGNWNYAADNSLAIIQNLASGESLTERITVSSIAISNDGISSSITHTVVITIMGADEVNPPSNTNSAAIISGVDSGSVTEDVDPDGDNLLEVAGKLNITDSDAGEAAFVATTSNGNYGNLTITAAGDWSYAANNSQSAIQSLASYETLKDSFTVRSIDGTTHIIVVSIRGADEANQPAVISGTDNGTVTEDVDPDGDNLLEVAGKLNITDGDAGEAAFVATTSNGNYGSLTINAAGNWNYAANNSQSTIQNLASNVTLQDNLTVSSIDGTKHTIVITIIGVDEASTTADINLSWVAPSEREDNTSIALSEIAGYKIYYGTTQGQYSNSVDINDGSAESYTFKSFPSGIYFFVITTLDTEGRESQYSPEVKKVV